jgi:hypothetical protein
MITSCYVFYLLYYIVPIYNIITINDYYTNKPKILDSNVCDNEFSHECISTNNIDKFNVICIIILVVNLCIILFGTLDFVFSVRYDISIKKSIILLLFRMLYILFECINVILYIILISIINNYTQRSNSILIPIIINPIYLVLIIVIIIKIKGKVMNKNMEEFCNNCINLTDVPKNYPPLMTTENRLIPKMDIYGNIGTINEKRTIIRIDEPDSESDDD